MRRDRGNPRLAVAGAVLLGALLALSGLGRLEAQSPWEVRASYERQWIDSELPQWTDWERWEGEGRRFFDAGNVALQLLHGTRFGLGDAAAALDGYIELTDRTYGHARLQIAPDARILPRQDHRFDLFQATEGGWEGSAGYRFMEFPVRDVHVLGLSLARYLPHWYLRIRTDVNPSFEETALLFAATARRFLPALDGHVELTAGGGEEVVEVSAGPSIDIRGSRFVAVSGSAFPTDRVGVSLDVGYWDLTGLPTRIGLGAGVILRW